MSDDRNEDRSEPAPSRDRWTSSSDAVAFVEHLSELTRSGLPLDSGLRALSAEVGSRALRRSLRSTADQIERGMSLEQSVAAQGTALPGYLRGMIEVGIRSGALADVLAQFVRYRSIGRDLRRRFWISLAYPLILLVCVVGLILFVMTTIVTAFESVMRDFGLSLPRVTLWIFQFTHFVLDGSSTWGPPLLISVVILVLGFAFLLDAESRRRLLTAIPVVGATLRFGGLSEFCHLLGTLVEARMPLPEAIELAANAVSDPTLARAGAQLTTAIRRGRSFQSALGEWHDCPAGLAEMLAWAEQHRNLPESLHLAGEMYESRARSQAGFAGVLFGTLTLILVVWGVGITIVAMYLPMINLISRLSG